FQSKCTRCHGKKPRKADLDLSTPAGVQAGSESGPIVVPGKPEESLLFEKVQTGSMPPAKKDRLSEAEVALIRRWIEGGAKVDAAGGKTTELTRVAGSTQHDVIPILLRRCTACHGLRRREGGLDLRTRASMLRGGKSGPAVVPGKPEESLIIKRT